MASYIKDKCFVRYHTADNYGLDKQEVMVTLRNHSVSGFVRHIYREELELERERWRRRPGDLERERRRTGERLLGERDLLLMRGGLRRHMGGGGGILRGGDGRRGGGRIRWVSTAAAVIS